MNSMFAPATQVYRHCAARPWAILFTGALLLAGCSGDDSGDSAPLGNLRLATIMLDSNADGEAETETRFNYGASGLLETTEVLPAAGGAVTERSSYVNDTANRVEQVQVGEGNSGSLVSTLSLEYDMEGREITRTLNPITGTGGRVTTTQLYDDDSLWTGSTIDNDGDGAADASMTNTYNSRGQLIEQSFDMDMDGTADRIDTLVPGANGQTIRLDSDTDNDGQNDTVSFFDYEPMGCVLSQFAVTWGTYCQ